MSEILPSLAGALEDIGYSVVGPALSLPQVRELLINEQCDAAVLDNALLASHRPRGAGIA